MKTLRVAIAISMFAVFAHAADEPPETVAVTVKAKTGHETQLEGIMKKHWATVKRLGLVTDDPHVLLRGNGGVFIDIFTWKSVSIPDNAPPEVLAVWKEMNEASVKLDIAEMKRVPVD